jgi:hypothetical protein
MYCYATCMGAPLCCPLRDRLTLLTSCLSQDPLHLPLPAQYEAQQLQNTSVAKSDIFQGVAIHVNGYTRPSHAVGAPAADAGQVREVRPGTWVRQLGRKHCRAPQLGA